MSDFMQCPECEADIPNLKKDSDLRPEVDKPFACPNCETQIFITWYQSQIDGKSDFQFYLKRVPAES